MFVANSQDVPNQASLFHVLERIRNYVQIYFLQSSLDTKLCFKENILISFFFKYSSIYIPI